MAAVCLAGMLARNALAAPLASAPPPVTVVVRTADGADVPLARARMNVVRSAPSAAEAHEGPDDGSLVLFFSGVGAILPPTIDVFSTTRAGAPLDALRSLPLTAASCPAGTSPEVACAVTPRLRGVVDDADRDHPSARSRSIRVELGGRLGVRAEGIGPDVALRVAGPAAVVGAADRMIAGLRVRVVRDAPRRNPSLGTSTDDAIRRAREEIAWANAALAQCGIELAESAVEVVDPPPPSMIAFGCEAGAWASGGEVRFSIDGKAVVVSLAPRTTPREAARAAAAKIEALGFSAILSDNTADTLSIVPTSDLLVRRRGGGASPTVLPASGAREDELSTDASLRVCVGRVDLSDGLTHFSDANATSGTLEERALLKAFDRDAGIEVFFVPSFASAQRVGESFMGEDLGPIRNVAVEDRAGVRAGSATSTLAHEIGHLLFAQAGHPDDYAHDTPTLLMDSDAVGADAYGPRRVPIEDCIRARHEHGPGGKVELLRLKAPD